MGGRLAVSEIICSRREECLNWFKGGRSAHIRHMSAARWQAATLLPPPPERKTERMRDLDSYRCGGRGDFSSESVASLSRLSAGWFLFSPFFPHLAASRAAFSVCPLAAAKLFRKITWSRAAPTTIIGRPPQYFDKLPPIYFESKTFAVLAQRKRKDVLGCWAFLASWTRRERVTILICV